MNTCRTCLKIPATKDIMMLESDINEDNKNCLDIMLFVLNIKVKPNSNITTNLCNNCYRKIISFYKFKALSLQNDAYLNSLDPVVQQEGQKHSLYVDENGIKHENFLDHDEFGPSVVEDCDTEIKDDIELKNEIEVDNCILGDIESGEEHLDFDQKIEYELVNDEIKENAPTINKKGRLKKGTKQDIKNVKEVKKARKQDIKNVKKVKKARKQDIKNVKKVKKARKQDIKNVIQGRQVCEECGLSVIDLEQHYLRHRPRDERVMLQCKACPKTFLTRGGRYRHYKITHLGLKPKCDICNKEVTHLSAHKLLMHEREAAPFGCASCARRFVSRNALETHVLMHTDDRAFECDLCHLKFRTKEYVAQHIRRVHNKEKRHQCELCSSAFFDKSELQGHLSTHETERLFVCAECGKACKSKDVLRKHRQLHTDERKYSCELCQKSFKVHSTLWMHMQTHTKRKAYPCQFCDARFGRTSSQRRHELSHHKHNKQ